jgi:hypothetical protein
MGQSLQGVSTKKTTHVANASVGTSEVIEENTIKKKLSLLGSTMYNEASGNNKKKFSMMISPISNNFKGGHSPLRRSNDPL